MGIRQTIMLFLVACGLGLSASAAEAQAWRYSFGADVVEVSGHGARFAAFSYQGSGPSDPGWSQATTDRKVGGNTVYRVRIECTAQQYGGGSRIALVSPWQSASNASWSTGMRCPPERPYNDWYATLVQGASQGYYFNCQFNDATFGSAFVGCGSNGEWF